MKSRLGYGIFVRRERHNNGNINVISTKNAVLHTSVYVIEFE
jgi:hypothetical protein